MKNCHDPSSQVIVDRVKSMRIPHGTFVLCMLIVGLFAGIPQSSLADDKAALSDPTATSALLTGEVTGNYGTSVQINGLIYPSHPSLVVTDDEGRPRALKDAAAGMQVKYHLKENQIDQLIIILMR